MDDKQPHLTTSLFVLLSGISVLASRVHRLSDEDFETLSACVLAWGRPTIKLFWVALVYLHGVGWRSSFLGSALVTLQFMVFEYKVTTINYFHCFLAVSC